MTAAVIIIALAFAWLGYETDWLRVKLLVGIECAVGGCCPWRMSDSAVTEAMKDSLINSWESRHALNKVQVALLDGGHMTPMCGWGYAFQFRDFRPEYKIELIDEHCHFTMQTANTSVLRDAFRVWRNPYLKVNVGRGQV